MNLKTGMAVAAATCAMAGVAQGQKTLKMDINQFSFTTEGGALTDVTEPGGFNGEIKWTLGTGTLKETSLGFGGRTGDFSPITTSNALFEISGHLFFSNNELTSGDFRITLDDGSAAPDPGASGDYYEATMQPFAGTTGVLSASGSAYSLTAFTWDGAFKDASGSPSDWFGDIDVSDWTAYQGIGQHLFGEFMKINFGLAGKADMEVFVMVPLPPAAYAGLGMLVGVMGLSYAIRRR